jgi:glycosyltransferase involved in cell wall biosynthesis
MTYEVDPSAPLLSVIIATYKRADDLERCIDSVLAEVGDYFEVVIGDDGSPDHTSKVVQAHSHDPRVRSYRNPTNLGMQANYLKIAHFAKGRYLFILTDDDYMLPGALARVKAIVEAHPETGYILSDLPTVDKRTGQVVDLHRTFKGDMLIAPGIASAAHVARSAWVLSRQVLKKELIDWNTWEHYGDNIFFPIILAGRLLLQAPAYYIASNLVMHTWFNQVHWEKFGRNRLEIEFNLAADRYQCMSAILSDRIGDPEARAAIERWQTASLRAYLYRPYEGFFDLVRVLGPRQALSRLSTACNLGPRQRRELLLFPFLLPFVRIWLFIKVVLRCLPPPIVSRIRGARTRIAQVR